MADIPVDTLPMQDFKAARDDGKGAGDSVSAAELRERKAQEPTGEEKSLQEYKEKREPFSKTGFRKRIDTLTMRSRTYEQENRALKARVAELEGKNGNGNGQQSSSDADRADGQETREEPPARRAADDPRAVAAREKFEDFDTVMRSASNVRIADEASRELHESPLAAHVSYLIAKTPELGSELGKLPPAQQVEEIRRIENHIADAEPGASALADRLVKESSQAEIKALQEAGKSNPHLLRAIYHNMQELADLSNGPAVYAHLARNPGDSQHIASLSKAKAAIALGYIAASLEREERPRTNAPKPISPVSGGLSRSTIELDKTDMATYKKLRSQGRVR